MKNGTVLFYLNLVFNVWSDSGPAIDQVVRLQFPTAAAQVQSQVRSCGVCDEQSGTGEAFLRVLWFPLPILIPLIAPHWSSSATGAIGQLLANITSGPSLTPPDEIRKKKGFASQDISYCR
jgi:hypothetical protein